MVAVLDVRLHVLHDAEGLHLSEGGFELLQDLHEGGHEEDLLVVAVDLYGHLVVAQLFHLEEALGDHDVLGLDTLVHLEFVQPVALLVLGHFLKIAYLLENCHFQQSARADHALPSHVLDDHRDCLGRFDVDVVFV